MQPWEVLIPITITGGLFYLIGFITHTIIEGRRRAERNRLLSDVHQKLLDRVASAKDFGDLLATEGGARFIDSLAQERAPHSAPLDRVLKAQQVGLVLSALGLGLLLANFLFVMGTDPEVSSTLGSLALLMLSGGIGFLVSSRTALRLSERYGLVSAASSTPEP